MLKYHLCRQKSPNKKIKENSYILKCTKHSTAETIYKHCKKLIKKKEDKTNQPIKIKVSFTMPLQKLLEYATKVIDDYSPINFVYTEINVNLKIGLKEPIKNRAVFSFNKKTELAEICIVFEWCAKNALTIINLFVCHHLCASFLKTSQIFG